MNPLELELKKLIIEVLDLEEIGIKDIQSEEPLFVDGLGLDSIDALELGVAIQKRYDIRIDSNNQKTKEHFFSVRNLAKFIAEGQK